MIGDVSVEAFLDSITASSLVITSERIAVETKIHKTLILDNLQEQCGRGNQNSSHQFSPHVRNGVEIANQEPRPTKPMAKITKGIPKRVFVAPIRGSMHTRDAGLREGGEGGGGGQCRQGRNLVVCEGCRFKIKTILPSNDKASFCSYCRNLKEGGKTQYGERVWVLKKFAFVSHKKTTSSLWSLQSACSVLVAVTQTKPRQFHDSSLAFVSHKKTTSGLWSVQLSPSS